MYEGNEANMVKEKIKNDPVLTGSAIPLALGVVFLFLEAFNIVHFTTDQKNAIIGVLVLLAPVIAWVVRHYTTPYNPDNPLVNYETDYHKEAVSD